MSNSTHDLPEIAKRAIGVAGGSAKLGRALGIRRSAVHGWRVAGIPPARVPAVSRITGIALHDLRPDLFDAPNAAAAETVAA